MYDGNAARKIEYDSIIIESKYFPHAKQRTLHCSPANEILYGGAAGPGKSRALREEGKDWCLRIPGLQVYLFRRTFPELERNHIIPMRGEIPPEVARWNEQKKRFEFPNGSMLHACHAQYEHDVFNYQGAEIHLFLPDELTTFTEFQYDYLRGRVRCPLEIEERYRNKIPGILGASNPGGVGHEFARRRWVDFARPYELKRASDEEGGMLRQYIPGLLEDNPTLIKNDPKYEFRLLALPEPYRSAYRWGKWDIWLGQAFAFYKQLHVIDPLPIPDYAQIYMTFDWGYGAPFSVGWWWVDLDNRLYRFNEWYGWNGVPNQGLRMVDEDIAAGIKDREREMGIDKRQTIRLAGPDCWNKKPDYMGGGQGPSTFEIFADKGLFLTPGDANRSLKIRQFRSRLNVPSHVKELLGSMLGSTRSLPDSMKINPNDRPMMMVYRNCTQFIRTIPLIQTDETNVEDIDTDGEDHIYDEACHICMARPLTVKALDDQRRKEQTIVGLINSKQMDKRMVEFFLDRGEIDQEGYNPLDKRAGY